MSLKPRIRITSHEDVVRDAHIYHVTNDDEGNEVEKEISSNIRGVDIRLHVGEVATARLDMIFIDSDVTAEVNDAVLKVFPPSSIPGVIKRLELQLKESKQQKEAITEDVTTVNDTWRRFFKW